MRRRVRIVIVFACVGAVLGAATATYAYFGANATVGGSGQAHATSVSQANAPTASITAGRAVTVTWGASTLANGAAVDGYLVTRYDASSGTPQLTGMGCNGTIASTTCTELFVPPGSWTYAVTPLKGANWQGPASGQSGVVTVGSAALSLTKTTLGLGDFGIDGTAATLTGTLSGFAGGEGIGYRLDGASGTTLSGTPANAAGSGAATVSITLPRTGDGAHTIYAVGTGASSPSQATAPIVIDTVAPGSSASGVDSLWHNAAVTATLSASDPAPASGVASIAYHVDSGSTQTIAGANGNVIVAAPSGHSNDGVHTITFAATDNAANTESPAKTAQVKIDTTAPATTLTTSPASADGSNGWFKQSSVPFTLAATDASSGVAATFYTLDGGATQTYASAVTVSGQGTHTITYWSTDHAGNLEGTHTTQIKLDNVAPATTLATSPASADGSNGWFKQSSVTFTLAATDATSAVAGNFYTIDGGGTQTYGGTVTINTQGDHTVTYWSTDNAGNIESTHTTHIKLDNVAPATTLTSSPAAADGSNGWFKQSSVTFTLAATDAASGVASRFYTIDGGATQTYSGTVTVNTQGDHTVVFWSADNAGNTESQSTIHLKLDSVPPATTDNTTAIGNGWKTTNQTVTLSPSDATSGLAATYYTTDGSTPTTSSSQGASISLTSDGIYTIKYFSVDNAGNSESVKTASTQIRIDKTAPSITEAVVANTTTNTPGIKHNVAYVAYANIVETGSGVSTATANLSSLGNGTAVALSLCSSGCTIAGVTYNYKSASQTANTTDGAKTFTVTSTDVATNSSGNVSFGTNVDDTAPTVPTKIVADALNNTAGFVTTGGGYYIYANVSDTSPSSGIATVTASLTNLGGSSTTPLASAGGPWTIGGTSYAYRSSQQTVGAAVTAGNKAASVTATDNAGNTVTTANFNTAVDNTAPTATAAPSPAANAAGWDNSNVTITLSASDAGAGVNGITYSATGAQPITTTTVAGASTTVTISTEGTTVVTYSATDNVGNAASPQSLTIKLDKTAPAAGSFSIPSLINNGQVLTNAATDALSGVASVGYFYCAGTCTPSPGTLAGTGTVGPNYSFTWSAEPADGAYTVVARVTDAAGNTTDSSTQAVTIDNTVPAVTAVTLTNGGVAKQADSGDSVAITYSETIDAATFCSAWSNGSTQTLTNAVVTITNNGATDGLTVTSSSCTFHLGTVVPGDYVSATVTFTSSTISWDPATKKLTITLGTTASPGGSFKTNVTAAKPTYTPDGAIADLVGNTISTSKFSSGTATGF